jgi:hypothetical protein
MTQSFTEKRGVAQKQSGVLIFQIKAEFIDLKCPFVFWQEVCQTQAGSSV